MKMKNTPIGAAPRRRRRRPSRWRGGPAALLLFALVVAWSQLPSAPPQDEAAPPAAAAAPAVLPATDAFVKCELRTPFGGATSARGTLRITVRRGPSPRASSAFLSMVTSGHFDRSYLFRVVKGFVVQWGIEALPPPGVKRPKYPKAEVDLVGDAHLLNVRGSLNFAGMQLCSSFPGANGLLTMP